MLKEPLLNNGHPIGREGRVGSRPSVTGFLILIHTLIYDHIFRVDALLVERDKLAVRADGRFPVPEYRIVAVRQRGADGLRITPRHTEETPAQYAADEQREP